MTCHSTGSVTVTTIKSPSSCRHRAWLIPRSCPHACCARQLRKGKQLGDRTYKVHLDGYDQTDLVTGKGPSKRHEIWYFTEGTLSAARINDFKYRFTDQPNGWLGATVKVDWPILTNLRLDPYERLGMFNGKDGGSIA